MIHAEIVADSISILGERLVTFVLTFPRIILSEFNTHRMFSRNSASSRAIPFNKMVDSVMTNPFVPVAWQKSHKGMQGFDYHEQEDAQFLVFKWLTARDKAVEQAQALHDMDVTKQMCNRLLEPFMWHKVICTSTMDGLNNFFDLRSNEAAEIHIQQLALCMQEAMIKSSPKKLQIDEWHMPLSNDGTIMSCVANCARVSYTVVGEDKTFTPDEDFALFQKLLDSKHWSPFEHCALQSVNNNYFYNLKGWKSLRYLEHENETWSRIKG
jgi:thymidylate synthase ThyX